MKISIIIPTMPGREEMLDRAQVSLAKTTEGVETETVTYMGLPSVGVGWQMGLEETDGDYILLGCDDLEWLPGWWQAAVVCCDRGFLPGLTMLLPDGSVARGGPDGEETEFTPNPFLRRDWVPLIAPIPPIHYYSDNWVAYRGRCAGIQTVLAAGYACIHHSSHIGHTKPWEWRIGEDRELYERYVSGELPL